MVLEGFGIKEKLELVLPRKMKKRQNRGGGGAQGIWNRRNNWKKGEIKIEALIEKILCCGICF